MQRRYFIGSITCLASLVSLTASGSTASKRFNVQSTDALLLGNTSSRIVEALSSYRNKVEISETRDQQLAHATDLELCYRVIGTDNIHNPRPHFLRESFVRTKQKDLKNLQIVEINGYIISNAENALGELFRRWSV